MTSYSRAISPTAGSPDKERRPFQSAVAFEDSQIEQMIREIGDVLATLQRRSVLTYETPQFVSLLEKPFDRIEFKHLEIHEVRRFISLVQTSSKPLRHLAGHLSHQTVTKLVERSDRIMGAASLAETSKLRSRRGTETKSVVCTEIERRMDTPENLLLCLVLFSIILYSDSYLRRDGLTRTGETLDEILLLELRATRRFANILLMSKALREMLPVAIAHVDRMKELFAGLMNRVGTGQVSRAYASLYRLFYDWRYFVWVVSSPPEFLQRNLREYFLFELKDPNKLYECWVFYRVLQSLAETFDLAFKEICAEGAVTFISKQDPRLSVTYQRRCRTGWVDENGKEVEVLPDIIVEVEGRVVLIVDAKNAAFNPPAYLDQMDQYLRSKECRCETGLLVHSSAPMRTWKEFTYEDGSKIVYTHLTPKRGEADGNTESHNANNLGMANQLIRRQLSR